MFSNSALPSQICLLLHDADDPLLILLIPWSTELRDLSQYHET